MNITIFSPNKNPYSETFIQAHKNELPGTVSYYYGVGKEIQLEGATLDLRAPQKHSLVSKIVAKITGKKKAATPWWKQLSTQVRTQQIDVILVEYGTHAYSLLPFLKEASIPYVVHFHGFDAAMPSEIERCDRYKDVFATASKIIAVSTEMHNDLRALGCPEEKLALAPYGPHPDFLKVHRAKPTATFVGIGRFVDKKAPYFTVLAFAKAHKKHPQARLIMAGEGYLLNTCQNLVTHLDLEGAVSFPGVIDRPAYIALLEQAIAFVQHSVESSTGDKEGTPVAILEAQGAGVPVIATRHAGIKDVVVEEVTGLLGDEKDVEAMANAMIRLLDNPTESIHMGVAARKRISENYTLAHHIDKVAVCLKEAMATKP